MRSSITCGHAIRCHKLLAYRAKTHPATATHHIRGRYRKIKEYLRFMTGSRHNQLIGPWESSIQFRLVIFKLALEKGGCNYPQMNATWTNVDPNLCRKMASLGPSELRTFASWWRHVMEHEKKTFRINGYSCGKSNCHCWFPTSRTSYAEFLCFLCCKIVERIV